MAFDDRIRSVERLSVVLGLNNGGYPNFQEADLGDDVVYGTIFFQPGPHIEWRDVRRSDLGGVMFGDGDAFFRAFDNHSNSVPGAMCGIPTCEQAIVNGEVVYGAYFLKAHPSLEWREVRRSDLGGVALSDVEGMFRAVDNFCSTQSDLFSGFPSFQQGLSSGEVVYGVYFLKTGYPAVWRDVHADVFNMLWKYSFGTAITDAQRLRLLERHAFGYGAISACGNLTAAEKTALRRAYRKRIVHGVSSDVTANASGAVGGASINVNFANLFPLGDDEIAQTLVHEMMHCAGFTHPERRNPPAMVVDTPFDNGQYYGSPPLRAELCIAGSQSDRSCVDAEGGCVVLTSAASTTAIAVVDTIAFNPPGPDVVGEHVLIRNLGGVSLDMSGWSLKDVANHRYAFPAFALGARSHVRVWTGQGVDDAHNLFWGRRQAVWNNTGDTATLSDAAGTQVASYTYP